MNCYVPCFISGYVPLECGRTKWRLNRETKKLGETKW